MQLRSATRSDHEAVDGAFGRFAIGKPGGYRDFLIAHARILPLAERMIDPASLIADWQGRTGRLLADLAAVGGATPAELEVALPRDDAGRWGALYVLEGSRLGGAVIARGLPAQFPASFLEARHPSGAWRAILDAIDGADRGPEWREAAVQGAKLMFGAYRRAAG
jgi:heme oxygenase